MILIFQSKILYLENTEMCHYKQMDGEWILQVGSVSCLKLFCICRENCHIYQAFKNWRELLGLVHRLIKNNINHHGIKYTLHLIACNLEYFNFNTGRQSQQLRVSWDRVVRRDGKQHGIEETLTILLFDTFNTKIELKLAKVNVMSLQNLSALAIASHVHRSNRNHQPLQQQRNRNILCQTLKLPRLLWHCLDEALDLTNVGKECCYFAYADGRLGKVTNV